MQSEPKSARSTMSFASVVESAASTMSAFLDHVAGRRPLDAFSSGPGLDLARRDPAVQVLFREGVPATLCQGFRLLRRLRLRGLLIFGQLRRFHLAPYPVHERRVRRS